MPSSNSGVAIFPFEDLNAWMNGFHYSRSLTNPAKEFSDGLLVAEIISQLKPSCIKLGNYRPAFSMNKKKDNWDLLNRQVLEKLNVPLSSANIHELAEGNMPTLAMLLMEIRETVKPDPILPKTQHLPEKKEPIPTVISYGNRTGNVNPNFEAELKEKLAFQKALNDKLAFQTSLREKLTARKEKLIAQSSVKEDLPVENPPKAMLNVPASQKKKIPTQTDPKARFGFQSYRYEKLPIRNQAKDGINQINSKEPLTQKIGDVTQNTNILETKEAMIKKKLEEFNEAISQAVKQLESFKLN